MFIFEYNLIHMQNQVFSTPKFPSNTKSLHAELKRRVNEYLEQNQIKATGNFKLFSKAILLVSLLVLTYIHLVFYTPGIFLNIRFVFVFDDEAYSNRSIIFDLHLVHCSHIYPCEAYIITCLQAIDIVKVDIDAKGIRKQILFGSNEIHRHDEKRGTSEYKYAEFYIFYRFFLHV